MPFDCAPSIDAPDPSTVGKGDLRNLVGASPIGAVRTRPIPSWHISRHLECRAEAMAVLARARALLSDEQRWCQGSFARGWFDVPVPPRSALARRYCALGAIMRAGRELGAPTEAACKALERQTVISVADWNDHRLRIHAEVISAFDAAIAQLDRETR